MAWFDVTKGEGAAVIPKGQSSVAAAVVSHYAGDLDADGDAAVALRRKASTAVPGANCSV